MIDILLYSIAGKSQHDWVDTEVQRLIDASYIPKQEKQILNHVLETGKKGNYPSKEYFETFYSVCPGIKSKAEILLHCDKIHDFYRKQKLQKETFVIFNETSTTAEAVERLQGTLAGLEVKATGGLDRDKVRCYTFKDESEKPDAGGIITGIAEVDSMGKILAGNVMTLCGFTGHGKTTSAISIAYKNISKEKKDVLFISAEMPPEQIWLEFQSRFLYDEHGIQVAYKDMLEHKLNSDTIEKINEYDEEFKEKIGKHLVIIDQSFCTKSFLTSHKEMQKLFSDVEDILGNLDLVLWDHIGFMARMYENEDIGNQMIVEIQTATKTYINRKGERLNTIMLAQANREGFKRASKRGGRYDLAALSEFNELERASAYVLFIYSTSDMQVVQEMAVYMPKVRIGAAMPDPVTTTFIPSICLVGATVEDVSGDISDAFAGTESFDFSVDDF